jgi:hypothetical protein
MFLAKTLFFMVFFSSAFPFSFYSTEENVSKKETTLNIVRTMFSKNFKNEYEWEKGKKEISAFIKANKFDPNTFSYGGYLDILYRHPPIDEKLKLLISHGLDLNRIKNVIFASSLSDDYFTELLQKNNKIRKMLIQSLIYNYLSNPEEEKTVLKRLENLLKSGLNPNDLISGGGWLKIEPPVDARLKLLVSFGLDLNKIFELSHPSSLSDEYFSELSEKNPKTRLLLARSLLSEHSFKPEDQKTNIERLETLFRSGINPNDLFKGRGPSNEANAAKKIKLLISFGLDLSKTDSLSDLILFLSDNEFAELCQKGNQTRTRIAKNLLAINTNNKTPDEIKTIFDRLETLLNSGTNPHDFIDHQEIKLGLGSIERKIQLLLDHGIDFSKVEHLTNFFDTNIEFVKKLIDEKKIRIESIVRFVSTSRAEKQFTAQRNPKDILWLKEVSEIINKIYGKELINPSNFNTLLHKLIKNKNFSEADRILTEFHELIDFANIDDETPIAMSYRVGNMDAVAFCAYWGAKNVYGHEPCDDITRTLQKQKDWQKKILSQPLTKDFNLDTNNTDTLFIILCGQKTKGLIDIDKLTEPLIHNGVALSIIGDGVSPIDINGIIRVLSHKKGIYEKFAKINFLVVAHGASSKDHIANFANEPRHHRVLLKTISSEKTEDLFHAIKTSIKSQNMSIFMYSCYGGLALDAAIKVFKDRNGVVVVTLSKPNLPVSEKDSSEKLMNFSSDPEKLHDEVIHFPQVFIDKYLINIYEANNVVGIYENGQIHFGDDLLSKIDKNSFLSYLDSEKQYQPSTTTYQMIRDYGLTNTSIFEGPLSPEDATGSGSDMETSKDSGSRINDPCVTFDEQIKPISLDTARKSNNIKTAYSFCIHQEEEQYCKDTFTKPEYGLLQYHALNYLRLCSTP